MIKYTGLDISDIDVCANAKEASSPSVKQEMADQAPSGDLPMRFHCYSKMTNTPYILV